MTALRAILSRPLFALAMVCALLAGCGTTKWSDSPRTATEQLLVSDAIDRAISEIDFGALADKSVFLDTRFIVTMLDQNYVVSTLRQHMLASGVILKDKAEDATYVVEVRTGSVGTNRQDLLFGIPATNLPTGGMIPVGTATIPEIALMKRTNQQGVCKIACFAYDRWSGRPVWQSGNRKVASRAKDVWVMGAGPFQRGTIYDGTAFAGEKFSVPLVGRGEPEKLAEDASVTEPKVYSQHTKPAKADGVENAAYNSAAPISTAPPATAPATPPASASPAAKPADGKPADAKPGDAKPAEPPKAAYTPPPPVAAPPPPPAPVLGPQGTLSTAPILPATNNPAATTAGAIQTFNWAKGMFDKRSDTTTP